MKKYVILKSFLYFIFILGIIYGILFVNNDSPLVLRILFTISISGLVGIGTNTIAIRMLFRPLNKTKLLRRQGLLPKNKEKIASTIAIAVKERILNEETISKWIENEEDVEQRVNEMIDYVKVWVKKEENKLKIKEFIKDVYNSDEKNLFFKKTYDFFVELLVGLYESKNFSFSEFYKRFRGFLKREKEKNNPYVEKSIDVLKLILKKFFKRNSHLFSEKINKSIDDYIKSQKGIKSFFMNIGRAVFIDDKKVEEFVEKSLSSEEKLSEWGDIFEEMLPELDNILNDAEVKYRLKEIFEIIKYEIFVNIKEKKLKEFIAFLENKIDEIFTDNNKFESLFNKIESIINKIIEKVFEYLRLRVKKGNIGKLLKDFRLGEKVESIVKQNILNQNLEEFEELMKRIMGENLAFIEVLGGFLGLIIGIGLHFKIFLVVIPLILYILIFIDNFITKLYSK